MNSDRPVITLSAGDPPNEDLLQRGMGPCHLDDGVLRVARALLRRNVDIAYAGYLRGDGFTASLAEDTGKVVLGPRFISFLGWPFSEGLTTVQIADTLGLCRFVKVDPDIDTDGVTPFAETPEFGWAMAQATTATRQLLFSKIECPDINGDTVQPRVAQILFAGKATGFLGVMPGIAEEFLHALSSNLAVYIVGAFGGAARLLAESLTGTRPAELFSLERHQTDSRFQRMLEGARASGSGSIPGDSFERLQQVLQHVSEDLSRLQNGLGREDNRQLMLTSNVGHIVQLIAKGMSKLGYN